MALYFETNDPPKLLNEFKKAIKEGKVVTWSYDKDDDFTHTPEQWKNQAWLRPKVETGRLAFYILRPENSSVTSLAYAIYHGRFIESMLLHCDNLFAEGRATALPAGNDNVSQG